MNKKITLVVLALSLGISSTYAKGVIPIGQTERIKVVKDFPDTDEYRGENGRYLDLGIIYETFDVAWMPVCVTEKPRIVGLENLNTEEYYDFEPEYTQEILEAHELQEDELIKLSFWDKYLGIVVLGGLFIGYLILNRIGGSDEEENSNITS